MSILSIIFLTILFGGFITTVIVIHKKRRKFWGKGNNSAYIFDGPDASGDIFIDHPHSSSDHGADAGGADD